MKKEITKAAEWGKASTETWVQELRSGFVIRMRRPSMLRMVHRGILPSRLFSVAMRLTKVDEVDKVLEEHSTELIQIMRKMVMESVVEPKVVDANPKEGEICIDDIPDDDQQEIFNLCQATLDRGEVGEGESLSTFPKGNGSGNTRQDGAAVRPASVKTDRAK